MKAITKPIKRGRITESALAAVILTGAIAVTASGCTAEIKLADGTPIGSVVINDEALASGITVNQQGVNADVITDPTVVLPDDNFDDEPEFTAADTKESDIPETTPAANETEPVKTTEAPAETTPKATETPKTVALDSVKDGSVLKLRDGNDGVKFTYNEGWGYVFHHPYTTGRVWVQVEDKGFALPIKNSELGVSESFLLKKNGQVYLYITAMHGGDICEINVYSLEYNSINYVGCYDGLYTNEINSVDSFSCYEHYGRNYMFTLNGYFKVGNDGMPVLANSCRSIYNTSPSRIKFDFRGRIERDGKVTGETKIINKGDVVKLLKTDLESYIDVAMQDGTVLRLDCTKYFNEADKNNKANAIFSLFEIAKDFDEEKAGTVNAMADGRVMVFQANDKKRTLDSAYGSFVVENNIDSQKIQITYNRHAYVLPVHTDNSGLRIGSTFLVKTNGKAFIYVTSCMDGDLRDINVYEVNDSSIKFVGHHKGMYIHCNMTSADRFLCYENDGMNGMMSISRYYKASANGMPVIADTTCYVKLSTKVKASKDITGYVVKAGKATNEKYTIKAGDQISFTEFNEVTYFDITDSKTGIVVRVSSEPLLNEYYDDKDNHWVYRALLSLVEMM
jgi:hypothetical protein